jgi:amino acid transporter
MINTSAIVNITNLPAMVVLGFSLITYIFLAAIFFFLPTAFVSAELATGFTQRGGFYSWVRIAFGPVVGFMAIWLQWLANVIWYPTLLSPIFYMALNLFVPSIASDKWLLFITMNIAFWGLTILNLRGMRESSFISTVGVLLGSILPALLFIVFAIVWIVKGLPIQLSFNWHALYPNFSDLNDFSILISIIVTLVGMEMSAVHVNSVQNPRKAYPKAAFISAVIILCSFIFTSLAMAVIVPANKIDLVNGVLQVISEFATHMHLPWLMPVMMVLIIIGILTMASTWIVGPSKGLQVAAIDGDIPSFFLKQNKKDMPARILILQASIFTLLSLLFVFVPSVSSSYWLLIALTALLYMMMYFILFCTGIMLRIKYPQVVRAYAIPGKYNSGMFLVAALGIIGVIMAFIISFFPPEQFSSVNNHYYVLILLAGLAIAFVLPVMLFCLYYYLIRPRMEDTTLIEENTLPIVESCRLPFKLSDYALAKKIYKNESVFQSDKTI